MNRIAFSCLLMAASIGAYAQMTVYSNGNVGIACSSTPASKFAVGGGESNFAACIKGSSLGKMGLYVNAGLVYDGQSVGIYGRSSYVSNYTNIGVVGESYQPGSSSNGKAVGVVGTASGGHSGRNLGVYGGLNNSANGAGIFGTTGSYDPTTFSISFPTQYAGYFDGLTKVAGNVQVTGTITNNVLLNNAPNANGMQEMSESFADRLNSLQTVAYYHPEVEVNEDDSLARELSSLEIQAQEHMHYGLQAEQLKEAFPELVYEQEDGTQSINYLELVPVLVQTIKEQNKRIEALEGGSMKKAATAGVGAAAADQTYMLQNNPNPANGTTTISYSVPATAGNAEICICDMAGVMKKSVALANTGKASVTVSTADLVSGIYLYSLVVDGEVCATKRMIVKH